MATTRYLSDVPQMFYGPITQEENRNLPQATAEEQTLSETIQGLPQELHEIIFKHFIAIKIRQRAAMGWDEIHQAFKGAPFCEKRARVVKILYCRKYDSCRRNGLCTVLSGDRNYLGYPVFDVYDNDKTFQKYW